MVTLSVYIHILHYMFVGTNECEFISGVCKNGKCMDTDKSFRCMCNEGYKLSMNGQKCIGE